MSVAIIGIYNSTLKKKLPKNCYRRGKFRENTKLKKILEYFPNAKNFKCSRLIYFLIHEKKNSLFLTCIFISYIDPFLTQKFYY